MCPALSCRCTQSACVLDLSDHCPVAQHSLYFATQLIRIALFVSLLCSSSPSVAIAAKLAKWRALYLLPLFEAVPTAFLPQCSKSPPSQAPCIFAVRVILPQLPICWVLPVKKTRWKNITVRIHYTQCVSFSQETTRSAIQALILNFWLPVILRLC